MAEPYQRNSRYTGANNWQGQATCAYPFGFLGLANLLWPSLFAGSARRPRFPAKHLKKRDLVRSKDAG